MIGSSLSCPDRLSLFVKFCLLSAALAAVLSQSVKVCKLFGNSDVKQFKCTTHLIHMQQSQADIKHDIENDNSD